MGEDPCIPSFCVLQRMCLPLVVSEGKKDPPMVVLSKTEAHILV